MEDRHIRIGIQVFLNLVVLIIFLFTGSGNLLFLGVILANGLALAFNPALNGLSSWMSNLIYGSSRRDDSYEPLSYQEDLYQARKRVRESRWEEAIALYRKILERAPDRIEARFELATAYQKAGMLGMALLEFRTIRASRDQIGDRHPFVLESERQIEDLKKRIAGREEEGR